MSDLTDSLRSTAKHRAEILCAQTGAANLYKPEQMVEWEAAARIEELEKCMETPRVEDLDRIDELESDIKKIEANAGYHADKNDEMSSRITSLEAALKQFKIDGKKLASLYWAAPVKGVNVFDNWDEIERLIAKLGKDTQ